MLMTVHLPALLVASLAGFLIGFLWHGPVFGKTWIALMGWTEKDIAAAKNRPMAGTMALGFVAQVVTAFVLALLARVLGLASVPEALQLAFWAWFGFIAPTFLNGVLWEGRSINLYLFNLAYYFVLFAVQSLIVTLWR